MRYTTFCTEVRRRSHLPFSPEIDTMLRAAYRHMPKNDGDRDDYLNGISRAVELGREVTGRAIMNGLERIYGKNKTVKAS